MRIQGGRDGGRELYVGLGEVQCNFITNKFFSVVPRTSAHPDPSSGTISLFPQLRGCVCGC